MVMSDVKSPSLFVQMRGIFRYVEALFIGCFVVIVIVFAAMVVRSCDWHSCTKMLGTLFAHTQKTQSLVDGLQCWTPGMHAFSDTIYQKTVIPFVCNRPMLLQIRSTNFTVKICSSAYE